MASTSVIFIGCAAVLLFCGSQVLAFSYICASKGKIYNWPSVGARLLERGLNLNGNLVGLRRASGQLVKQCAEVAHVLESQGVGCVLGRAVLDLEKIAGLVHQEAVVVRVWR